MINGLTTEKALELFDEARAWWEAEEVVGYLPESSGIRELCKGTFPYISITTLKQVCCEIFLLVAKYHHERVQIRKCGCWLVTLPDGSIDRLWCREHSI